MRPDYLHVLPTARQDEISRLHHRKQAWIRQEKKGFLRYRAPMSRVGHLQASWTDFSGDIVRIGCREEISPHERRLLFEVLRSFMPWRKGPFSIFGIDVDSEWRSERKWNRILPVLPDLKNRIIADIGSNNGYYMFRMAHHEPALVLGFEPYPQHYFTFSMLNGFARQVNLCCDLLGIEHLNLFPDCFDIIFCMGIIYHRPSPVQALRDLHSALKRGGTLILESQVIPGQDPVALFPEKTYAKVPGTWFVPTVPCLKNWLTRTGFGKVECFCVHEMSSREQRRTPWMVFESYEDFIDREDAGRTVEGYPAPLRAFFRAVR